LTGHLDKGRRGLGESGPGGRPTRSWWTSARRARRRSRCRSSPRRGARRGTARARHPGPPRPGRPADRPFPSAKAALAAGLGGRAQGVQREGAVCAARSPWRVKGRDSWWTSPGGGGVPASSLADLHHLRNPKALLGTGVWRCYIIEINQSKGQMVLSRKGGPGGGDPPSARPRSSASSKAG